MRSNATTHLRHSLSFIPALSNPVAIANTIKAAKPTRHQSLAASCHCNNPQLPSMSYSDDGVLAKLSALSETQDSIVGVAQWIMFHR